MKTIVKIKITNGVYTAYRVLLRYKILKKHQNYPYISVGHGVKKKHFSYNIQLSNCEFYHHKTQCL